MQYGIVCSHYIAVPKDSGGIVDYFRQRAERWEQVDCLYRDLFAADFSISSIPQEVGEKDEGRLTFFHLIQISSLSNKDRRDKIHMCLLETTQHVKPATMTRAQRQ